MRNIFAPITLAVGLSGIAAGPSFAQTARFDISELEAGCAGAASECQAVIVRMIQQLQADALAPEQLNTRLGMLASGIITAAQTSPGTSAVQRLAGALRAVAAASTDAAQTASIRSVAQEVARGNASRIDIITAFSASPA
ncbi:hypothetical protein [Pseudogemmobacter sp. W21_MBD1_M6]|uniref:hypothetical protein n=1 Tax=Pseudogemmobacter sp. W21_MBD1_M6 TaxID=3240271 RepID=UPI003F9A25D5